MNVDKYLKAIESDLNKHGHEVVFVLSRDDTNNFFKKYRDIFIYNESSNIITIKDNITEHILCELFRENLDYDFVKFFSRKSNIELLFK